MLKPYWVDVYATQSDVSMGLAVGVARGDGDTEADGDVVGKAPPLPLGAGRRDTRRKDLQAEPRA
jgi:hypothetical protein